MEPGPMTAGNAYDDASAPPIPLQLAEAIDLASTSGWLKDVLGDDQYAVWMQQAQRELDFFWQQVTPFETSRYRRAF